MRKMLFESQIVFNRATFGFYYQLISKVTKVVFLSGIVLDYTYFQYFFLKYYIVDIIISDPHKYDQATDNDQVGRKHLEVFC